MGLFANRWRALREAASTEAASIPQAPAESDDTTAPARGRRRKPTEPSSEP